MKDNGFSQELCERICTFIGKLNVGTGSNIIHEWAKTGYVGFSEEDRAAWRALRNKPAHGTFSLFSGSFDDRQQRISERNRIYGMINKLLLTAMGYEGKYFDYSIWRVADLPAAAT